MARFPVFTAVMLLKIQLFWDVSGCAVGQGATNGSKKSKSFHLPSKAIQCRKLLA
jgi:hypothetical protein